MDVDEVTCALAQTVKASIPAGLAEKWIEQADEDCDGRVDFREFCNVVRRASKNKVEVALIKT